MIANAPTSPAIILSTVRTPRLRPLTFPDSSASQSPTPRAFTRHQIKPPQLRSFLTSTNHLPKLELRRSSAPGVAMGLGPNSSAMQLDDVSDFERILSPDGYISICGFGSLLSERSARSTFPDLMNIRLARLRGFRRVFAHAAPVFFERGIAKPDTKEISSLSVEPCEGETLMVTVFEIQKSEIPSFMKRELEFRFLAVFPETLDGQKYTNPAVLCARYSDEEFFNIRCKGNKDAYHQHYGQFNIHKIWRDDIFPCRTYLRHCVLAAKNLGNEASDNFLDHTYLGDRQTSIREYLATTGSGIMEEEPPESLKTRSFIYIFMACFEAKIVGGIVNLNEPSGVRECMFGSMAFSSNRGHIYERVLQM